MTHIYLIIALTLLPGVAMAKSNVWESFRAHRTAKKELRNQDWRPNAEKYLTAVVARSVVLLEEHGHDRVANDFAFQFRYAIAPMFQPLGAFELGDHGPLFKFLDDLSSTLEEMLGRDLMEANYLTDIRVFNYAIPVVFRPGLNWGRNEYRIHFVPYAAASGYWSVLLGCIGGLSAGGHPEFTFACQFLARGSRWAMKKISPSIADAIYDGFND